MALKASVWHWKGGHHHKQIRTLKNPPLNFGRRRTSCASATDSRLSTEKQYYNDVLATDKKSFRATGINVEPFVGLQNKRGDRSPELEQVLVPRFCMHDIQDTLQPISEPRWTNDVSYCARRVTKVFYCTIRINGMCSQSSQLNDSWKKCVKVTRAITGAYHGEQRIDVS